MKVESGLATHFNLFRTYEQIIDEKDSGFFQKDHTIHQCFDWLVFKIFYKSVIFSKITAFFDLNVKPSEKYLDLV